MTKKIDLGGPAFPVHPDMAAQLGCIPSSTDAGMSVRDYFAAKALQGLLANGEYWNHVGGTDSAECAALAYVHADSMMKARNGD
jgi:hypothetical protein